MPSPRSVLVSYVNCHSHCCPETTTKCMSVKLHVPNISSGHKNIIGKFTQAVAVTEIMALFFFMKKCHLSHCYIHSYKEKHHVPLALAGIS